jgi:predicted nucleic acid-binding protein
VTVADSGPLIAYAQFGRLDLLRLLFRTIHIPETVALETSPTLPTLPAWILVHPEGGLPKLPL